MSNLPTIRCAKSGCDDPENTLMFGILDCRGRGTLSCVSSVEFFVVEVNDASAAFASSPDKFWLPQILFVFVAATVNEWYWLGIKFFVHEIYAFLSLLCSLTCINGVAVIVHNFFYIFVNFDNSMKFSSIFTIYTRDVTQHTIQDKIKESPAQLFDGKCQICVWLVHWG